MKVYVCVTLYHVYLTLLYIFSEKNKNNSIVLLNANNERVYAQYKYIAEQMKERGFICDVRLRTKKGEFTGAERKKNRKQLAFVDCCCRNNHETGFTLVNFAWNNSYVYSTVGLLYRECKEAIFVEESTLIAKIAPEKKWKILLHKVLGDRVDFYKDEKLKEIRVQKPEMFPLEWKSKLAVLDINDLVKRISNDDKKEILEIMSQEGERLGSILNDADVGIVYTSPISEQNLVSESTKIDYINKICSFYERYGKIVLKLHPRDTTVYPVDNGVQVLPAAFPSELLALTGYQFKFAVAICSSAVNTTNARYKINMNENFYQDKVFVLKDIDGSIVKKED